jgi:hypothetical protein
MSGEPGRLQWSPGRIGELVADRGRMVDGDISLLEAATRLGTPTRGERSLVNGRVAVARLGPEAG